jgi:hypothetical protein
MLRQEILLLIYESGAPRCPNLLCPTHRDRARARHDVRNDTLLCLPFVLVIRASDSAEAMSEYAVKSWADATELAAMIRTKQLSSREVAQAHLDRIAAVNPKINAIVTLLSNDALKGADSADKAVKHGAELGPLHGVPFTIKNTIDTAGVLTQRGSRILGAYTFNSEQLPINVPTIGARSVKLLKHGTLKSYPGMGHGMLTTHASSR